jgi:hypothetical protein
MKASVRCGSWPCRRPALLVRAFPRPRGGKQETGDVDESYHASRRRVGRDGSRFCKCSLVREKGDKVTAKERKLSPSSRRGWRGTGLVFASVHQLVRWLTGEHPPSRDESYPRLLDAGYRARARFFYEL